MSWRAGALRRLAIALFGVGALLTNLPPGPVPLVVLALGGIIWGVAVVLIAPTAQSVEGMT